MMENPVTCSPSLSLLKCMEKMRSSKVDSLMVVDKTAKLLGIINAKQIQAQADRNMAVETIMNKGFLQSNPEDTIIDILKIVDENNVSNIPVLDEKGILFGLITKSSLVTTLSQQFLETEGE